MKIQTVPPKQREPLVKVRLVTGSFDFIAEVAMPDMVPMPEVVQWGYRFFVQSIPESGERKAEYREALVFAVPAPSSSG